MVIKKEFWCGLANENRRLHIYLPDSYYDTNELYPVMYFFDGHNLFYNEDATYGTSWGFKEFMDYWNKPMIIVGIECSHHGDDRLSEYNPYPVCKGMFSRIPARGDDTIRWIIDEVKPMIDKEYRTYSNRACTGIAGSSMGGLMAFYGMLRYNWCFSKAACVSSAFGFCMPLIYRDLKDFSVDADTRVYFSWGTNELKGLTDCLQEDFKSYTSKRIRSAAQRLVNQGAAVKIYCQIGGGHCEADWRMQNQMFMDFLWNNVG